MRVITEKQTVSILASLRTTSDGVAACEDAAALFALKSNMVEMLDCAGDFIALQQRLLDARPVAPTMQKLKLSQDPPEAPQDGDSWGNFRTGKIMVAKDGEWLDPADGVQPRPAPPAKYPPTWRGFVSGCFDGLPFIGIGMFIALAIIS